MGKGEDGGGVMGGDGGGVMGGEGEPDAGRVTLQGFLSSFPSSCLPPTASTSC